jgi:protein RecA
MAKKDVKSGEAEEIGGETEEKGPEAKIKAATTQELISIIEKKYGKGSILRADKARGLANIPRIATGIFTLDLATWGGFPVGRVITIFGPYSSCKSGISLKGVVGGQRMCPRCLSTNGFPLIRVKSAEMSRTVHGDMDVGSVVCTQAEAHRQIEEEVDPETGEVLYSEIRKWVCADCGETDGWQTIWMDAEGVWENAWSIRMGVWIDWVYVIRTEYAEQAIDIADAMLRSGKMDLLVIDSLAHLTPKAEIEESSEDWQVGLAARLVNKALRKWVSSLNREGCLSSRRPTIILINQIREKVGVMFGSPEVKPGGKGQEFASSLDIRTSKGAYYFLKEDGEIAKEPKDKKMEDRAVYVDMAFVIKKSRVCPARSEGEFQLWVADSEAHGHKAGDIDDSKVVWNLAKKYNLIVQEKTGWSFGEGDGKIQAKTQKELYERIVEKYGWDEVKRRLVKAIRR